MEQGLARSGEYHFSHSSQVGEAASLIVFSVVNLAGCEKLLSRSRSSEYSFQGCRQEDDYNLESSHHRNRNSSTRQTAETFRRSDNKTFHQGICQYDHRCTRNESLLSLCCSKRFSSSSTAPSVRTPHDGSFSTLRRPQTHLLLPRPRSIWILRT